MKKILFAVTLIALTLTAAAAEKPSPAANPNGYGTVP
jgi:opacity protein-like surface antigen